MDDQTQPPSGLEDLALSPEISDRIATQMLQLIGLAVRARQAVTGSDAVMAAIQSQKARLVVLASDAGDNAAKKYRDKCAFYHIHLVQLFNRDILGHACGRSQCVVIAVTDPGFAAKVRGYVGEFNGGDAFDETSGL